MRRTTEEIIKAEEEKMAIKKQRLKEFKKRNLEEQRKKRTKRLIETGAVVEKALGIELDTIEKREKLYRFLNLGGCLEMKQNKYKNAKYVKPVCNMLQIELTDFIKESVDRAIEPFLDSKGRFSPEPGIIVDKKSNNSKGKKVKSCMILDPNILMFGKQYVKVFAEGKISKLAAERVKKAPIKKNKESEKNA